MSVVLLPLPGTPRGQVPATASDAAFQQLGTFLGLVSPPGDNDSGKALWLPRDSVADLVKSSLTQLH